MKKFNPRKYAGKDRVYLRIPKCTDFSRLFVWDADKSQYRDPQNGKKYLVRRFEYGAQGKQKRVTKYFRTFEEAKEWQDHCVKRSPGAQHEILAEFRSSSEGQVVESLRESERYLVQDLLEDYRRHKYPLLREGTRGNCEARLARLGPLFNVPVEEVSPKHIDVWLDWLKAPEQLIGYKPTRVSFEGEFKLFKTMLNWHLGRSDETRLVLPFLKRHYEAMFLKKPKRSRQKFMTGSEAQAWFDALKKVSPELYAPALVQVCQLFRVSEVFAMKWSNCDLDNRSYRVAEYVYFPREKGKGASIQSGGKTMEDGEYYISPLRERVVDVLCELKKSATTDLIFHHDGNLWTYRQVQYGYNKAFEAAGLPYRSSHVCRHTGATMFYEETGDLLAVQQMGNWKCSKMAQNYAKLLNDRARRAVDKADQSRKLKGDLQNKF